MGFVGPVIPDRSSNSQKARVDIPRKPQSNVKPKPELTPVSGRDKNVAPRGGYTPNSPQARKASAENFLADLRARKTYLDNRIEFLRVKIIEDTALGAPTLESKIERQKLIDERIQVLKDITFWETQRKNAAAELALPPKTTTSTTSGSTSTSTGSTTSVTTVPEDTGAAVNLSATKELYFRGEQKFLMDTLDIKANSPGYDSSLSNIATYQTAETLWKSGIATKGRIQTFVPFTGNSSSTSLGGRQLAEFAASKSSTRKAFQFHYNPGSVDMSYGSVNDVDLGYLASGQAVTNFLQALGQVSFEILLNRMPDMKFINPNASNYRKSGVNYAANVYDREPLTSSNQTNELKDIYNKGTMYDLEFLLKVLMGGVSFKSQLRGGELTSDLGFAIPQPVELHLGNRLRYVISVTSLQVRHVIFNERMVPLFSTVSIVANRVPADTVSVTNLDLGGGQASASGPVTAQGTLPGPANPTIR